MSDLKLVVAGAAGRMGQAIIRQAVKIQGLKIIAGLEANGHPAQGRDLGTLAGIEPMGAIVQADALTTLASADAVIDFTTPAVSLDLADLSAQARIIHVIGTTGIDTAGDARIKAAARHATIIKSGSMSQGVNLLVGLVELAARALGPAFDIEIIEQHHRMKVDAPSGTALLLGQAAARAREQSLKDLTLPPHFGNSGPRETGPIGFASIRAGSIIGDHTVILAGEGERIELTHRAEDRTIFANGALRAVLWARSKGPGLFDMQDVLGLRPRVD